MGREIEIKVPLTASEFSYIYDFISGKIQVPGIEHGNLEYIFKQDEYYSKYNSRQERLEHKEPQVIRLRTEQTFDGDAIKISNENLEKLSDVISENVASGGKSKAYFTIKFKSKENGIELNREDETFVEDKSVLKEFFEIAGYFRWFNKEKCSYSCYCKCEQLLEAEFHLELEVVNNLLYLEVEVTDESLEADKVKEKIAEFMSLLKVNPEKRDSRSWVEILNK